MLRRKLLISPLLLPWARPTSAGEGAPAPTYDDLRSRIERDRQTFRAGWQRDPARRPVLQRQVAGFWATSIHGLCGRWLGTPWGRGRPQSTVPGQGKINCGSFVGTLLAHAGFVVDVPRLQRQPSLLIIKSFVPAAEIRRCSKWPLDRFVDLVGGLGQGLFIVGLDLHVGLLVHTGADVRFLHSNVVTGDVADEPARKSTVLRDTRFRALGKLQGRALVQSWLTGTRIPVLGGW